MQKAKFSKLVYVLSLTAVMSITTSILRAEDSSATQAASVKAAQSVSDSDSKFVKEASEAGTAEVEFGKLAATKASTDSVKQFANQMVKDHTEANDKLKKLAEAKGLQLNTELSDKHKKTLAKLEKLSGDKFDKEYMTAQREDHKKAVSLFKKQSEKGNDPDLKNFAATTLPTLENHKKEADNKPEKTAKK
jgi:putative membrane protein